MAMSKDEFRTKVTTESGFREQLKKDPAGVLRSIGWDVPDGVDFEVVDMDGTKQYLVLPPIHSQDLEDDNLAIVQGGTSPPARIEGPTV